MTYEDAAIRRDAIHVFLYIPLTEYIKSEAVRKLLQYFKLAPGKVRKEKSIVKL